MDNKKVEQKEILSVLADALVITDICYDFFKNPTTTKYSKENILEALETLKQERRKLGL